jgi:hypothetical protein
MNPVAENLSVVGQLQANLFAIGPRPRDDSIASSTSSSSTNGALSAAASLTLESEVSSSGETSDNHTPPQQSPPQKQHEFESLFQEDSPKGIPVYLYHIAC